VKAVLPASRRQALRKPVVLSAQLIWKIQSTHAPFASLPFDSRYVLPPSLMWSGSGFNVPALSETVNSSTGSLVSHAWSAKAGEAPL
jgi:hypothetical protein